MLRTAMLHSRSAAILCLVTILSCAPTHSHAQKLDDVAIGARIRVIASDSIWVGTINAKRLRTIGLYQGSTERDVFVRTGADVDTIKVARRLIRSIHVSDARRSRWAGAGKGALIGLGIGAATILVALAMPASSYGMEGETSDKNLTALVLGVPLTLVTTLTSATVLSFRQDRWRRIETPE
jgi:hypothetical protein